MAYNNSKLPNFLKPLFKERNNTDEHYNRTDTDQKDLLDYYVSFVQNHPDIILVFTLDGKVVSHNQSRINEHLGYSPKQKISFKELVSQENYTLLISTFRKALKGSSERVEINVFNKQGEQLYIIGTFTPIEVSHKNIVGVFLNLEDVTVQKQLDKSNELKSSHLEQVQQIAMIGSWEYFIAKDKMKCSKKSYEIFGLQESEFFSMATFLSIIYPEDYDETKKVINKAITDGTSFSTEFQIYHGKTNKLRHVKVNVKVQMKDNKPIKFIGIVKDNTEQRKLDIQIIEMNSSYRHIFDNLHVGIWMSRSTIGELTFASKGMEDIFQIPLSTMYDKPDYWKDMILPMYREEVFERYKLLNNGDSIELRYRIKDGNGTIKWIYEQTIPKINDSGEITHLFGMLADISTEIEMQKRFEFLAKNDALTSLPNHYSLYEKINELIKNEDTKSFALFYMNLDNFNWINDYFGYKTGDIVLQKMTSRLISVLPKDGYLAKVDGAVIFIMPNYQSKDVIFQLAEEIIRTIRNQIVIDDYKLHFTASIGISFYPDNGNNKLILLENARTALCHAKRLGKDNYQIYSFDRDISSHKKYMLERDLRKAIQNEEFEIYYQPQVNPKSGAIEGAEALIRWNHKDWGVVSPKEFIPIAEEKLLIQPIGDWVIRTVCKQLQDWKKQGYTLYPIAINISPIRFLKPGIVSVVKRELEHHQIPAKYVELEITESTLLQNEKYIINAIQELRELGIKVALDDFGAGYSSFHYLQRFKLDTLKIDQMFIRNLDLENERDVAIVSSFLHLAKGLNMKIVAEGVEKYEQLEFLKQKECDIIQGYLYSKPVPVDQFEQMMKVKYLKPKRQKLHMKPDKERRKYFRFVFPDYLTAKMNITEVNNRKVNLGSAVILVENISLGGLRLLSTLSLPVNSNMKFTYQFQLMNETFNLDGSLIYKSEEKEETYSYGVSFNTSETEKDKLAEIINKMTMLKRYHNDIPDTDFIEGNPYSFLHKRLL